MRNRDLVPISLRPLLILYLLVLVALAGLLAWKLGVFLAELWA